MSDRRLYEVVNIYTGRGVEGTYDERHARDRANELNARAGRLTYTVEVQR
jgi:hypothetical protein